MRGTIFVSLLTEMPGGIATTIEVTSETSPENLLALFEHAFKKLFDEKQKHPELGQIVDIDITNPMVLR